MHFYLAAILDHLLFLLYSMVIQVVEHATAFASPQNARVRGLNCVQLLEVVSWLTTIIHTIPYYSSGHSGIDTCNASSSSSCISNIVTELPSCEAITYHERLSYSRQRWTNHWMVSFKLPCTPGQLPFSQRTYRIAASLPSSAVRTHRQEHPLSATRLHWLSRSVVQQSPTEIQEGQDKRERASSPQVPPLTQSNARARLGGCAAGGESLHGNIVR